MHKFLKLYYETKVGRFVPLAFIFVGCIPSNHVNRLNQRSDSEPKPNNKHFDVVKHRRQKVLNHLHEVHELAAFEVFRDCQEVPEYN